MPKAVYSGPMTPGLEQARYWNLWAGGQSFVYAISPVADSPVKIGIARDAWTRFKGIQTNNHCQLELRWVLVGDRQLEKAIHSELQPWRIRGEWFDGTEIEPTLIRLGDLAEQMVEAHKRSREVPRYWDFAPFRNLVPPDRERVLRLQAHLPPRKRKAA